MLKIITIITKFIVATIIALLFASCGHSYLVGKGIKGSGNITSETRTLTQEFKNIEVSHGIKVIVEQLDLQSVTVEADDNLQQHIITNIENGVLKIKSDENYNTRNTPIVTVKTPVINGLQSSSGSEIIGNGVIITNKLNVRASSGSQIKLEAEADDINLEASSGSQIEASGKALKAVTSSNSGSSIEAKNLLANEVNSQSSSGSSTSVYPILKLVANASSGSSIRYFNIPKSIAKEESSGGSISEK